MNFDDMRQRIGTGQGFIAALDQSGGSTPKALKGYGIEEGAWKGDEEMFGLIHQMRSRIITSPSFSGEKVIGAILFERTMDGEVEGKPTPQALIERGVAPVSLMTIWSMLRRLDQTHKNVWPAPSASAAGPGPRAGERRAGRR